MLILRRMKWCLTIWPGVQRGGCSLPAGALYPDAAATYSAVHTFDADAIQLTVACPHTVDSTRPLAALRGIRVQHSAASPGTLTAFLS